MILIFDCPTQGDSQTYSEFSEQIITSSNEILMVFLDTEIPTNFLKAVQQNQHQSTSGNLLHQTDKNSNGALQTPNNLISTYEIQQVWLLIGLFAASNNKQVRIFTDQQDNFKPRLMHTVVDGNSGTTKLNQNINFHQCSEVSTFSVTEALNPWMQFDNQEALSSYEIQQLRIILKKFIKQVVTSKMPNNLEKLLNIAQNLVKAHLSSIQKERYKVTSDLAFHFLRSLFLDKVLDNPVITQSILANQIQTLADFENFTKIEYTPRFETIIDNLKQQIQAKQQKVQQQQQLQQQQLEALEATAAENQQLEDQTMESEDQVVKTAIQTLFDQYLSLFHKAKIFEIKKLHKLMKQIANYVTGFIMKKDTAAASAATPNKVSSSKDKAQALILQHNHKLVCANILKVIARLNLIKMIDQNIIEHDNARVNEVSHDQHLKILKDSDFILDKEQAEQIFDLPILVFKKDKTQEEAKLVENPEGKKDPVAIFIDQLYAQMKGSKHFPNSLRELERLIRKNLVKKSIIDPAQPQSKTTSAVAQLLQQQDEDTTVEQVLRRMNEKGMFTQKTRTGESKEHAKDQSKLKGVSILELYKREKKEDIPIVFESNFSGTKQPAPQQQTQQHQ